MTEINYLEILKLCFLGGKGGCSSCSFKNEGFPKCLNFVYKGIKDTINHQKAENLSLQNKVELLEQAKKMSKEDSDKSSESAMEVIRKKEAEIERLQNILDILISHSPATSLARKIAVKEVLDRLIDVSVCKDNGDGTESLYVSISKARQVIKEMVGEG